MAVGTRWLAVVGLLAAASPAARAVDGGAAAPVADDPTLIALAVALVCAEPPATAPDGAGPPGRAEVELVTTVRARSLRLDAIPRIDGVLRGLAGRGTTWRAERVNLPARPEPGVVYRDVEVRLTLSTDVDGLAAMLREAKQAARGLRLEEGDAPPQDVAAAPVIAPELVGSVATASAAALPLPPPPPSVEAIPPVLDDGPAGATTTAPRRDLGN